LILQLAFFQNIETKNKKRELLFPSLFWQVFSMSGSAHEATPPSIHNKTSLIIFLIVFYYLAHFCNLLFFRKIASEADHCISQIPKQPFRTAVLRGAPELTHVTFGGVIVHLSLRS